MVLDSSFTAAFKNPAPHVIRSDDGQADGLSSFFSE